jgi:Pvc16 N-terminal domain
VASSDAIAYFGDTLVKLLQDGLKDLLAPAEIFLSTLSDFKNSTMSEPTVTVFLYDVGTSGGTRTVSTGAIGGATPSDPLDLHLLITPWAPVTRAMPMCLQGR